MINTNSNNTNLSLKKEYSNVELAYEAELIDVSAQNSEKNKMKLQKKDSGNILLKDSNDTIIFCISIDGSKHSDYAFDIITEEFFNQNSKMAVVHVYSDKNNDQYN